jgi:MFS family permease
MWSSAVVAAVAAAAQMGVADLLGIIQWDGGEAPARTSDWSVQLTWVGFSFTVAVLTGALAGRRARQRLDRDNGIGARVTASVMAALGAGAAAALAWLPASDTTPPVRVDPSLVVAITAGAGVVVGLVVALIALSVPPVAAGLRTAITWTWLVAIGSAVAGITTHKPYPPPRLAVLDAPSLMPAAWWNGPRLMIAVAGLLGLVVALVARVYGAGRFGVALSGFAGPAVIASAYLIAGPGVVRRLADRDRCRPAGVGRRRDAGAPGIPPRAG